MLLRHCLTRRLFRQRQFRQLSTLLIAEHDNVNLLPSTLSAVTAAAELNRDLTVLVLGKETEGVADQVSRRQLRLQVQLLCSCVNRSTTS